MDEMANLIFNYGGTVILAVLFIYLFFADRNEIKEEKSNNTQALKELAKFKSKYCRKFKFVENKH